MKVSQGDVFRRREAILNEIKQSKTVQVSQLAQRFNVSEVTIRRDLALFEKKQMIRRAYGKAELIQGSVAEEDGTLVDLYVPEERLMKVRIAKAAVGLIRDEKSLFVNSGKTSLEFLRALNDPSIRIITNNALVDTLDNLEEQSIYLCGGEYANSRKSLVGDFALQSIISHPCDACFLGTGALNSKILSSYSLSETLVNRSMIENSHGMVVIMAEGYKLGKERNFMSVHTNRITHIVTDSSANQETLNDFRTKGIEVIVVDETDI